MAFDPVIRRSVWPAMAIVVAMAGLTIAPTTPAMAQYTIEDIIRNAPDPEKPTPYDGRLGRLSEVVGAVHYLRNLCNKQSEPEWRDAVQALIDVETKDEPKRRARLTAAYNRGYRSFASVYTSCTAAAVRAEENYRNEGATLATEITARYGN
jgi:uncharacterized protein (TIGR02301 family)